MHHNEPGSLLRKLLMSAAMMTVPGFMLPACGQVHTSVSGQQSKASTTTVRSVHIISDWSMRHEVFSSPGTSEKALQDGTYARWLKIVDDPRYKMQQLIRGGAGPQSGQGPSAASYDITPVPDSSLTPKFEGPVTHARFPNGVLPRGLMRALIPPPPRLSGLQPDSAKAQVDPRRTVQEIGPQRDWSELMGSNGTVGLDNSPATFSSNPASCTDDFAVFNTSLAGSSSQASIVAFNELYSGCTPRPSIYWAYDTGGAIVTSVTTSLDGTQILFVQTDNVTGNADLVILKWAVSSGTLTSPVTLTSNSSYPNCTAPCMISIPFTGNPTDSDSPPYIDYSSGNVYAGDDVGELHKFVSVFTSSTPAEATNPWPVTVNPSAGAALSFPIYDSVSGNIFVGDYQANSSLSCGLVGGSEDGLCGFLYSVDASTAAVTQSAQLDYNLGLYDGPIIDSSAGMLYAFAGADNSTDCSSGPCAAVFQLPVNFTNGSAGTEATVGAGYEYLFSGDFDNQYWISGDPPSGHLYVVGGTGPQNNTLYAITITNNVMTSGNATAGPVIATNYTNGYYAAGLPILENCNNGSNPCTSNEGSDYLFFGVLGFGAQFSTNPCTGQSESTGCIMGFTAPTSGVISSSATPNGTLPESGGPSAVVPDLSSNIYFSTLYNQTCATSGGIGGCAVSATQSGLQ
jgi:hypothetical protein